MLMNLVTKSSPLVRGIGCQLGATLRCKAKHLVPLRLMILQMPFQLTVGSWAWSLAGRGKTFDASNQKQVLVFSSRADMSSELQLANVTYLGLVQLKPTLRRRSNVLFRNIALVRETQFLVLSRGSAKRKYVSITLGTHS
jgi:hypothetical protein